MNKIAAIGMFDGVHSGHRHLWNGIAARCRADGATSLAVTFRNHPLRVIAPDREPPALGSVQERTEQLRGAGADEVLVLDFTPELRRLTGEEFVRLLARDYGVTDIVMGFNHSIGSDRISGADACRRLSERTGVRLHPADEFRLQGERTVSSSAIRSAICQGDIVLANSLLGRPYSLSGTVGHGKRLGRTLGFPTANIEPLLPEQLLPAPGVYALYVTLPEGSRRGAMANIGRRPTVTGSHADITIEVNIFDYDGDLYGRPLTLHFLQRMRDERRFDSLEALRAQLEADRAMAQTIYLKSER